MKEEILEIKERLTLAGIDTSNLVYIPVVPLNWKHKLVHEFVIEEYYGIKVAKLVSSPSE